MCGILYVHDPYRKSTGFEMASRVFLGLSNLQHRGQEGGGFAYTDGVKLWNDKFFGLIAQFYDELSARRNPEDPYRSFLAQIQARNPFKFLGHLRYPTAGGDADLAPFQPHYLDKLTGGRVVFASNGDIPSADEERRKLMAKDVEFHSDNDAELTLRKICYLQAQNGGNWVHATQQFMVETPGAYSGILMTKKKTLFMRDPWGIRPFLVGKTGDGVIVAASESCALNILDAKFAFEVPRGSVIEIDDDGQMQEHPSPYALPEHPAHCLFCLDYFARPDSRVFIDGRNYHEVMQKGMYAYEFGRELAIEHPVDADCVFSVPHSGNRACRGYSAQSGIIEDDILIVNLTIPRTFIMSRQQIRELYVKLKFGIMTNVVKKYPRICDVDDSLVRATTSKILVALLRHKGAKEVHVRLSFPPIISPCFQGIAIPTKAELAASSRDPEQIRELIGADSIGYLSTDGLTRALARCGDDVRDYCTACFTGNYPFPIPEYKLQP